MSLLTDSFSFKLALAFLCLGTRAPAQDTVRVRAENAPDWGATARLVELFTLGELDGPPEYAFGRIQRAAVDSDGFYLFDDRDRQIRRYDAQGVFVRSIGRKGGGPGEYQSRPTMHVTGEGLLLIYDQGTRRITRFRPDGRVHDELSLIRGDFDARGFSVDSSGRYSAKVRLPGPLEGPLARHQFLRLSSAGVVLDSLPHPAETTPVGSAFVLSTTDGARASFVPTTIVVPYSYGGMLIARSDQYRVTVTDPARPPLVLERKHTPVPLGREERSEWVAIAESMQPDRRTGRKYSIPRVKPAIRDLFSDHIGRIWVDVYVPAEKRKETPRRPSDTRPSLTWKERSTYDIYSPAGRYLGRLQLPAESTILSVRHDRVYLKTKGVEGEDRVGVYRIATAPKSSR